MKLYFIRLCWKNIWRNKRRTFLTVNAIAISITWLIWGHNYYDSFHEQLIDNVIRYKSGHLQITRTGFTKHKESRRYIKDSTGQLTWLSKHTDVAQFSPRVLVQGLISSSRGSANIWFTGIYPQLEEQTTEFASNLVSGQFLPPQSSKHKPMVVGIGVSERLKLQVGSKVVVLTQGIDGSIGNELFYISGIFNTQSEVDNSLAFIPIQDARELLSLPPLAVHQISVVLTSESLIPKVQAQFTKAFPSPKLRMHSWMDLQKHLLGIIELDKSANRILMFIILLVACVGITNSILMGILERTREFGIMLAIGTTKADIVKMVIAETLLLTLVGVLIGNLLGISITIYFQEMGFDLKWLTDQSIRVNGAIIQTVSYPTIQWWNNIFITANVLILSLFAGLIPIHHISKLSAAKALRNL